LQGARIEGERGKKEEKKDDRRSQTGALFSTRVTST